MPRLSLKCPNNCHHKTNYSRNAPNTHTQTSTYKYVILALHWHGILPNWNYYSLTCRTHPIPYSLTFMHLFTQTNIVIYAPGLRWYFNTGHFFAAVQSSPTNLSIQLDLCPAHAYPSIQKFVGILIQISVYRYLWKNRTSHNSFLCIKMLPSACLFIFLFSGRNAKILIFLLSTISLILYT